MTTKTTGAEIKSFYADAEFWPEGAYHEDEIIFVDGEDISDDIGIQDIPDAAIVTIKGGVVLDFKDVENKNAPSFEAHFKSWRKQQNFDIFVIEIPKAKSVEILEQIVALGAKIKK